MSIKEHFLRGTLNKSNLRQSVLEWSMKTQLDADGMPLNKKKTTKNWESYTNTPSENPHHNCINTSKIWAIIRL